MIAMTKYKSWLPNRAVGSDQLLHSAIHLFPLRNTPFCELIIFLLRLLFFRARGERRKHGSKRERKEEKMTHREHNWIVHYDHNIARGILITIHWEETNCGTSPHVHLLPSLPGVSPSTLHHPLFRLHSFFSSPPPISLTHQIGENTPGAWAHKRK